MMPWSYMDQQVAAQWAAARASAPPPPPPPLPKAPPTPSPRAPRAPPPSAAVAAPSQEPPGQESAPEEEWDWAELDEHVDIVVEDDRTEEPPQAKPKPQPPAGPPPAYLRGQPSSSASPQQIESKARPSAVRKVVRSHWTMSTLEVHTTWSTSPAEAIVHMPTDVDDKSVASLVRLHDNEGQAADWVERAAPLLDTGDWRTTARTDAGDRVPRGPVFNLATAVVTAKATMADVYQLVGTCTANILIIIWDPLLMDVPNIRQAGRSGGPAEEIWKGELQQEAFRKMLLESHTQLKREFDVAACDASADRERPRAQGEAHWRQEDKDEAYWHRGPDLFFQTGLVFYQPRVIEDISLADTKYITVDDEHVNTVLHVKLREWKKNPGARFNVAVPARYQFSAEPQSRLNGQWAHTSDWSEVFQQEFVDDVWRFDVRFLTGFFDCRPNTLQNVGERCGLACGDKPFHVSLIADGSIATHPNYTFALGAHDPQHPVYRTANREDLLNQEAAAMPSWMYPDNNEGSHWMTWFTDFMRDEVPTWGKAPMCEPQSRLTLKSAAREVFRHRENLRRSGKTADDEGEEPPPDPIEQARNKHLAAKRKAHVMDIDGDTDPVDNSSCLLPPPLPNLGKVASKRLKQEHFDKFWLEGIHINFIFVGQSLPSANSRANSTQKWKRSRPARRAGKNSQASRSRGLDWAGAARGARPPRHYK